MTGGGGGRRPPPLERVVRERSPVVSRLERSPGDGGNEVQIVAGSVDGGLGPDCGMEVDRRDLVGIWPEGGGGRPCSPGSVFTRGLLDAGEAARGLVTDGSAASTCMDSYAVLHGINPGLKKVGGLHCLPSVFPAQGIEGVGNPLLHALDSGVAMARRVSSGPSVLAGCSAQVKDHSSFGADSLHVSSHEPCTADARRNASPVLEQQNPNFNISGASTDPWRSSASAWKKPKVVPLPSINVLGQFSLDGSTALLDDGEVDAALRRLDRALVGRLFGKKIPYLQLSCELKRRWEVFGNFRLVTLGND